eukprot:Sspe_Gene.81470::Locus_52238_Transcript_1_1_Confidence_1.000_Length_959::g.81470::m.81470
MPESAPPPSKQPPETVWWMEQWWSEGTHHTLRREELAEQAAEREGTQWVGWCGRPEVREAVSQPPPVGSGPMLDREGREGQPSPPTHTSSRETTQPLEPFREIFGVDMQMPPRGTGADDPPGEAMSRGQRIAGWAEYRDEMKGIVDKAETIRRELDEKEDKSRNQHKTPPREDSTSDRAAHESTEAAKSSPQVHTTQRQPAPPLPPAGDSDGDVDVVGWEDLVALRDQHHPSVALPHSHTHTHSHSHSHS